MDRLVAILEAIAPCVSMVVLSAWLSRFIEASFNALLTGAAPPSLFLFLRSLLKQFADENGAVGRVVSETSQSFEKEGVSTEGQAAIVRGRKRPRISKSSVESSSAEDAQPSRQHEAQEGIEEDAAGDQATAQSLLLAKEFLQHVFNRLVFYTDDFRFNALELILEAPDYCVSPTLRFHAGKREITDYSF